MGINYYYLGYAPRRDDDIDSTPSLAHKFIAAKSFICCTPASVSLFCFDMLFQRAISFFNGLFFVLRISILLKIKNRSIVDYKSKIIPSIKFKFKILLNEEQLNKFIDNFIFNQFLR